MITYAVAKKYLDKRWSIIPVVLIEQNGKVEKRPAVPWKEYQDRLPTDEELHQWFDEEKYNGIGLVTGKISGLVVVDIDDPEDESIYSPLYARTISGGRHCYYRWTEEMRNDAGIDDKPLDFRGDGGFVVLPPSSCNGKKYSWEKYVDPMFLDSVPQQIKSLLKIRKQVPVSTTTSFDVSNGLPTASVGERNDTAARVAGILHTGVSRKLWGTVGWESFRAWNRENCNPPLDEKELLTTWNSIGLIDLRNNPEEESFQVFKGSEAIGEYEKLQKEYGTGLPTGFDELDKFFSFLPEQLYLLSAPTHQGKTTFALNMAARVASYGENVLFVSLEQGVFIAPRVKTMLNGEFPETLSIMTSHKMASIESLTEKISEMEEKPKIVFIDHLHFVKKGGKGATEDLDEIMANCQNMAKELRVPVFVIAHTRKLNADRPPELDDLRDSSSLSQVPSVVMLLHRPKNDAGFIENSYLSKNGTLFIAKNRIEGKTGVLNFTLWDSGEVSFY